MDTAYFELLSPAFFSGASAAFFPAPFAFGFSHFKEALILLSTVIVHPPALFWS